jgi:two-component system alkaline phosphatase synthesis response regulator PhoP
MVTVAQKKILVVDDEKDIVELIAYNLRQEGFVVSMAYDGQAAWEAVKTEKPDLAVLDLMLPGISGLDVCKLIRRHTETENLPVIMLTAKSDQVDKILGLELGADDYMTKPFSVRELLARIRAVLRRSEGRRDRDLTETFAFQGLHIDFQSCTITVDGKKVGLSSREFKLLQFSHGGRAGFTAGSNCWSMSGGMRRLWSRAPWMSTSAGCGRRSKKTRKIPNIF